VVKTGSSNKTLIIVVVLLALLLLCCCVSIIAIFFVSAVQEGDYISMAVPYLLASAP
jgi:hypothetical protein